MTKTNKTTKFNANYRAFIGNKKGGKKAKYIVATK